MNISVVIPLLNEEESIKELYLWIAKVMQANSFSYEVIFIDDGSTDTSWSIIDSLHKQHPQIKAIQFLRNFGKSQALSAGFKACNGDVVITMDADLQDDPNEIPELYKKINEDNFDCTPCIKFPKNKPEIIQLNKKLVDIESALLENNTIIHQDIKEQRKQLELEKRIFNNMGEIKVKCLILLRLNASLIVLFIL